MKPGTRVRFIADPGRTGVATERSRERGGRSFIQVVFPDRTEFVPCSHIEVVPEIDDDAVDLFGQGRFGRAKDLRGNMTYIRLNGQLANLIYSMETTNTDFYPYQFKPVLKFLDSPNNGLLIADEVGLGKTIEAGLIWTELRSRFDTRRLMVLCPAFLQPKWKGELRHRFGIDGDILGPAEVLERFQEFRAGTRLDHAMICSMQGLRPHRGWDTEGARQNKGVASELARFLEASEYEEPLLDLLIIDEAHYLRNPESMTAKLGRLLRAVAEHVVLLSATPIHLRNRDLYELLHLVDEDNFNQRQMFEEMLQANAPLIRARDAVMHPGLSSEAFGALVEEALKHPILKGNRQLTALIHTPPTTTELHDYAYRTKLANRLESINLLGHSLTRTRKRDVETQQVIREAYAERVPLSPLERQVYDEVTALVRRYCQERAAHEGFLLVMPQRQMSSSMPAALQEWQRRGQWLAEQMYEDLGLNEHQDDIELGPLSQELAEKAYTLGDVALLRQHDSKYKRLKDRITDYLRKYPQEKIVLFAYFRPTLRYLQERLTEDGVHCIVLTGSDTLDRYEVLEAFQNPKGPRVLLASEVASEGIDLQFARVLINYDLPWNPMKVEQRIGRIDRIGQQAQKIFIWNLFYDETIDARIYTRLYERLKIFEHALGGLEAVLGEAIQKLTFELLRDALTPEQQEARIKQTALALAIQRDQEETLEEEASHLMAHGDYILNQVKAARELQRWITGEDLWIYVHDFFQQTYPGCEFRQLKPDEYVFDVRLSDEAKFELEQCLRDRHLYGQTRLASSSIAPVRCRFVNRVVGNPLATEEILSQFHPLVRFVSSKLQQMDQHYFSPVSVDVSASTLDISTFILHQNQGQDAYEILTAEVKELGVLKLHQWCLHEVARLSEEWLIKVSSKGDGVTPIPKLGAYVLNPEQVQLAKVDGTFQKICALLILRVVSETKRRRNPLAPAWERGLPVFISGGGVQMPLYGEALESAAKMLTQGIIWAGFQRMALPKPSDLEAPGLDAHHYHRLAVAYGLSFSSLDIGRITPPGEIPDIAANLVRLNVTSRYVSKDMV